MAWLGSSRVPAVDARQTSEAAAPGAGRPLAQILSSPPWPQPAACTTTSCSTWASPAAPGTPCQSPGDGGSPPSTLHTAQEPGAALLRWPPQWPLTSWTPGPAPRDNSHYTTAAIVLRGDQLQPAPGASYGSYYLKIIKGKRKINIIIWAVSKIALIFLLRVKGFSDEDLKKQMKCCSCLLPHICVSTQFTISI